MPQKMRTGSCARLVCFLDDSELFFSEDESDDEAELQRELARLRKEKEEERLRQEAKAKAEEEEKLNQDSKTVIDSHLVALNVRFGFFHL